MPAIRVYYRFREEITVYRSDKKFYIVLKVDGVTCRYYLTLQGSQFFTFLDGINPQIPKVLRRFVTCITSREEHSTQFSHGHLIEPGQYRSRSSKCRAEVTEYQMREDVPPLRCVEIRGRNLSAWRRYRDLLVAGELTPEHSYKDRDPQKSSPTTLLALQDE